MIGACTTTPTLEYTDTPILVTTETPTVSNTPTALAIYTVTSTPIHFTHLRAEAHQIIFTQITENKQTIYSYDLESERVITLFEMPPEMSLHNIGVTPVPGQSSDELIPLPQREGLGWASLYLSPDAKTLAAITAPHGQAPSYIHQIDLDSKTVVSILIVEDYQWRIPLVEGRIPDILKNIRPGYEEYAVALALLDFPSIQWAPDSGGFIFTIQTLTDTPPAQMYFVSRYSEEAIPLIYASPGPDIGMSARWSHDGSLIAFPRYEEGEGIWIIDVSTNTVIIKIRSVSGLADFSAPVWSPDDQYLAINAGLPNTTIGDLYLINIAEDIYTQLTDLSSIYTKPGDPASVLGIQWTNDNSGIVFYEIGPSRENDVTKYIDIHDLDVKVLSDLYPAYYGGYEIPSIILAPMDNNAIFLYGDPCDDLIPEDFVASNIPFHFRVISIPEGDVLFEPPDDACFSAPTWSPDGHLIAGHSGDDIVIWDLDSGESTIVAPELEGRKIFLGWVPDVGTND